MGPLQHAGAGRGRVRRDLPAGVFAGDGAPRRLVTEVRTRTRRLTSRRLVGLFARWVGAKERSRIDGTIDVVRGTHSPCLRPWSSSEEDSRGLTVRGGSSG